MCHRSRPLHLHGGGDCAECMSYENVLIELQGCTSKLSPHLMRMSTTSPYECWPETCSCCWVGGYVVRTYSGRYLISQIWYMDWSGRCETENIATVEYYSFLGPVLQLRPGYAPSPLVRLRADPIMQRYLSRFHVTQHSYHGQSHFPFGVSYHERQTDQQLEDMLYFL